MISTRFIEKGYLKPFVSKEEVKAKIKSNLKLVKLLPSSFEHLATDWRK